MANKFQVKRTSVTGRTPNTTNSGNTHFIDTGELALNLTDGKMFSSNGSTSFEIGANLNNLSVSANIIAANIYSSGKIQLNNDRGLFFKTTGGSDVRLIVQNDDNLVLYSTNTTGGERPVLSHYANNNNSALDIIVPLRISGGIVANSTLGTSGQVLKTNGSGVYWGTVSGGGGSSVTMSDTAPGGASAGDLWWDTSSGRLYIYYDDGTSLQWVDASPGIPGPAGIDGTDGVDGADGADGAGFTSSTDGQINSLGVGTPPSNVTGEIRAAATITAFYSSDEQIKTNIVDIQDPIDKVKAIRGVTFSWTQEEIDRRGGIDGKFVRAEEVGVIAQEVEKVLPHVVAERPDGFKAVRYEMLVPLLIESIKEQQKQIEELQQIVRSI